MTSTPPPPRRIHTPPTPLHGPKFDEYEPYSPRRRSSRVAAQKTASTPSPSASFAAVTPSTTLRNPRTRNTTTAFSPPSSPNLLPSKKSVSASSAKRVRVGVSPLPHTSDSDTDILPEKREQHHRRTSSRDTFGMLNTPAKTPKSRRKDVNGAAGAARLLFGDNEGLLDPTPSRKGRNKARLDMFGILEDEPAHVNGNGGGGGIKIFTDSKERVPSLGDDEEANPFLSRNAAASSKGSAAGRTSRKKSTRDAQMEEAARNDEGMVYVFRGKKIFRKYEDAPHDPQAEDDDNLSDASIRRKAGPAAARPFTRSSVKPTRLLFPSEAQRIERERIEDDADEEALTDIEMPKPVTPTKTTGRGVAMTPPTTVRGRRVSPAGQLERELEERVGEEVVSVSVQKPRKRGMFDGFQRKKPVASAVTGRKREGSPMVGVESAKRTRSAAHS